MHIHKRRVKIHCMRWNRALQATKSLLSRCIDWILKKMSWIIT